MGKVSPLRQGIFVAVTVLAVTGVTLVLRPFLAPANLAMLYLVGVVAVAMRCGAWASFAASLLSVAAFDFCCVQPYYTLRVDDSEYAVTFVILLAVALIISAQTARLRIMAGDAGAREARTAALYRLRHALAGEARVFDMARTAAEMTEAVFRLPVTIFLPDHGRISFDRRTSLALPVPAVELEIAQRAFTANSATGQGTLDSPKAKALYLPLRGTSEAVGVMCVVPSAAAPLSDEQRHLLEVFAGQTALAMERNLSQRAAEESRLRMQAEQMRSSLLSSISHDLRTPLARITGAASTLRHAGDRLELQTRQELLDGICEEADHLSRLLVNLLDMTQLETGEVELRLELCPLEEIVGPVLQRLEPHLHGRTVALTIPESLPPLRADSVLLGQLLWNLL